MNRERTFIKKLNDGNHSVFTIHIDSLDPASIRISRGTLKKNGECSLVVMHPRPQVARNVGKKNYKSPEQVAQEEYARIILNSKREGYHEIDSVDDLYEQPVQVITEGGECPPLLSLDEDLPGFRPWKPQNTLLVGSELWHLAAEGRALFVCKKDGYGCVLCKDHGMWTAYSLKLQRNSPLGGTLLGRLPAVVEWCKIASPLIPDGTMFFGEIVPMEDDQEDSYTYVTSIIKSKPEEAIRKQEREGYLGIYMWDLPIFSRLCIGRTAPYEDRLGTLSDLIQSVECGTPNDLYGRVLVKGCGWDPRTVHSLQTDGSVCDVFPHAVQEPYILSTPTECSDPIEHVIEHCTAMGWEGVVVTAPKKLFGKLAWSISGRPSRPSCSAKLKPSLEDDFIAIWDPKNGEGEYGTGKNYGLMKSVNLYQLHNGELVYCGKCGTGFSDEERLVQMAALQEYPRVFQVAFSTWTEKGLLRNPAFVRHRTDKEIEECSYAGPLTYQEMVSLSRLQR